MIVMKLMIKIKDKNNYSNNDGDENYDNDQNSHNRDDYINVNSHKYSVEQEMLSYSSVLLGQSLVENMKGKNSLRREAMEAFLNSAK